MTTIIDWRPRSPRGSRKPAPSPAPFLFHEDEMSKDLIERLQSGVRHDELVIKFTERLLSERREAATEIERLRAKLAEAGKVIEPFADIAAEYSDSEDDGHQVWKGFDVLGATLPLRIFRAAAKWMEQNR